MEQINQAPDGYLVTLTQDRTSQQNRMMWSLLHDVAEQKKWCGVKMDAEDWKHLFTAALKGERTTRGLTGGIVVLSNATSKMSKEEMSELIDYILAWGTENQIIFSDVPIQEIT